MPSLQHLVTGALIVGAGVLLPVSAATAQVTADLHTAARRTVVRRILPDGRASVERCFQFIG